MRRLDRYIAFQMLGVIAGVIFVFFCIIALSESLDSWRLSRLAEERGSMIAFLSIAANSVRWSINALPVTVMLGGIVALINMQRHGALVVMKASGLSIWQIMRGPVIALALIGLVISLVVDTEVTKLSRFIQPAPLVAGTSVGADNEIWLEQSTDGDRYIMTAASALTGGQGLRDITVFFGQNFDLRRIIARKGEMQKGHWLFSNATIIGADGIGKYVDTYSLKTDATIADIKLMITSTSDLTFFELATALKTGLTNSRLLAAAATRFSRLLALPVLVVGTLLIAFAFTSGYRRTGSFGGTILYGIVLGFVMFVVNQMAEQSGSAGVLTPGIAAWGPAIVTVVIGLTVLLYREDGRV